MLACYLVVANLFGLTGFDAPTSNFSITLAITIVTFTLIQFNAFKKKGAGLFIKDLIWPPTNLLSAVSPLISLSMRLFGNILAGECLVAALLGICAYVLPLPIMFFEVLVSCVQALVFTMLTTVYIATAVKDEH